LIPCVASTKLSQHYSGDVNLGKNLGFPRFRSRKRYNPFLFNLPGSVTVKSTSLILSLDLIRPQISKASLWGVGIAASESSTPHDGMVDPRELSMMLTRRRQTNQTRAATLDSVVEEVEA
jgi:hypothetical protein